ncbi:MAG TPA: YhjD/YihY/BrkB family envelope integrity protein [Myxococcota bacterium]|nr:YhjD/YihY/BrkB family envelope integrity protein [Myxococcota bacterium]
MIAALEERRVRLQRYLDRDLWRAANDDGALARAGRRALQVAVIVSQGLARNHTMLRASALTYFTMLSLIPLLAVAIGMVEVFGAGDAFLQLVARQIGAVSPEVGDRILSLVRRVDFRSLGAVGAGTLFLTTVLALSNVEKALNFIWGVSRQRPLARRFPDYLAVLVVAPLLLTVAISLATSLSSDTVMTRVLEHPVLARLYELGLRQAPTLLFWGAFTFLYWFLPNTTVRPLPALAGGALAALLFSALQAGYVAFQVGVARSNALFGSFAALPVLLVWIFFSWAIVLLGAELAFALQNFATFRQARLGEEPSPAEREAVGLALATRMARAFRAGAGGLTAEGLAGDLDVPVRTVRALLGDLESAGLVATRGDDKLDGFQLGRAAESITVAELLTALRGPADAALRRVAGDPPLCALFSELDTELGRLLRERSLADLATGAATHGVDPVRCDG